MAGAAKPVLNILTVQGTALFGTVNGGEGSIFILSAGTSWLEMLVATLIRELSKALATAKLRLWGHASHIKCSVFSFWLTFHQKDTQKKDKEESYQQLHSQIPKSKSQW